MRAGHWFGGGSLPKLHLLQVRSRKLLAISFCNGPNVNNAHLEQCVQKGHLRVKAQGFSAGAQLDNKR